MHNKLLLTLALLTPLAHAQQPVELNKPVVCAATSQVLKGLSTEYGEQPLWGSQQLTSTTVLFVNHTTKTWTLVEFDENLACVISTGTGYVINQP